MQRLGKFPLEEPSEIAKLRRKSAGAPMDTAAQIALGAALSEAGCTYEAAALLRPLRAQWKSTAAAQPAKAALEAQTWWNKNWRDFARLKQAGKKDAALALLGERGVLYWDLPPLLIHLAEFAADDGQLALADHLCRRVLGLAEKGLPKMNMASFTYVAEAGLVEVLLARGKANDALERHRAITPNSGNAMAHEIQLIKLLVATGNLDEAIHQAARSVTTARKHRSGYSREMRMAFIETAPELAPLRQRADWSGMLSDPAAYIKSRS